MDKRIRNPGTQFFVCFIKPFGARVHPEKTCTSKDFFQKSCTLSCILTEPSLFTK